MELSRDGNGVLCAIFASMNVADLIVSGVDCKDRIVRAEPDIT
jgi:hypothetical protein